MCKRQAVLGIEHYHRCAQAVRRYPKVENEINTAWDRANAGLVGS